MPGIDVTRLRVEELRRLLQVADERGQADLSGALRKELLARSGLASTAPLPWYGGAEANPPAGMDVLGARGLPNRLASISLGVLAAVVLAAGAGWWGTRPAPARQQPLPPPVSRSTPATKSVALVAAGPSAPIPAPPAPAVAAPRAVHRAHGATPTLCAHPRSTADRMVCRSPRLLREHRRMQVAYERALASGADRLRIDRAQARWRLKRNSTADAERLAKLYRARIRQLEDARRRR